MKVKAVFHGILWDWLGKEEVCLELPEGASLRSLMSLLRSKFSHRMPEQLWDPGREAFARQVMAVSRNQPLRDLETTLQEGQEIHFFLLLAGG